MSKPAICGTRLRWRCGRQARLIARPTSPPRCPHRQVRSKSGCSPTSRRDNVSPSSYLLQAAEMKSRARRRRSQACGVGPSPAFVLQYRRQHGEATKTVRPVRGSRKWRQVSEQRQETLRRLQVAAHGGGASSKTRQRGANAACATPDTVIGRGADAGNERKVSAAGAAWRVARPYAPMAAAGTRTQVASAGNAEQEGDVLNVKQNDKEESEEIDARSRVRQMPPTRQVRARPRDRRRRCAASFRLVSPSA